MSETDVARSIRGETIADGVVRWTLDNPPKRNAIHPDALAWIEHQAGSLRGEVVLLAGAGERGFSAGFDLDALPEAGARGPDGALPDQALIAASEAMEAADATFVAALGGYTIGAAVELACACDVRLAHEDAWFRVPAARLGVVYHARGIQRFRAVFGGGLTRRLLLLGERITAAEALTAGAVQRVFSTRAALDEAALALALTLHELPRHNTKAHREMLRALDRGGPDAAALARHERARREAYADLISAAGVSADA